MKLRRPPPPAPPKRQHKRWQDYPGDLITERAHAAHRDGHLVEIKEVLEELEADFRLRLAALAKRS